MLDGPEQQPEPDFTQQQRMLRFLWRAFLGFGLGFAVFATFMRVDMPANPERTTMIYGLAALQGVASLAGSVFIRTTLLGARKLARTLADQGTEAAAGLVVSGHVFLWGAGDACGAVGALVGITGGSLLVAYLLIGLGLGLLVVQAPGAHTISDLRAAAEQERVRMGWNAESARRAFDR